MSDDAMRNEKILVKVKEAAAMLSIGESTLWREVRDGRLPAPIKIGGATRWRVSDLVASVAPPANDPTKPSALAA